MKYLSCNIDDGIDIQLYTNTPIHALCPCLRNTNVKIVRIEVIITANDLTRFDWLIRQISRLINIEQIFA